MDDFRLAQERGTDDITLFEDEAMLLERYQANPWREGELPPGLTDELQRVRARVDELRRVADAKAEQRRRAEQEAAKQEEERQRAEHEAAVAMSEEEPIGPRPTLSSRNKASIAILGSGLVSLFGGVTLVRSGAWAFEVADARRDQHLALLGVYEYESEDAIRADLEHWHQRTRNTATGLTVGGAVLAGVGLGLTTWGVVRLRRAGRSTGRRASIVLPVVTSRWRGVATTVTF